MLRLFQRVTAALMLLGGVGVVLMMLNIVADVVSKLIWNAPIQGTVEVSSYYYMIALVMLPMAFVEMEDEGSLEQAIQMFNGYSVGGRALVVVHQFTEKLHYRSPVCVFVTRLCPCPLE